MGERAAREVELTLLGDCSLAVDGHPIESVPANFFRIVAYLALAGGRHGSVTRRRIHTIIWGERGEAKAAANLRQALVRIRNLQTQHGFELIETGPVTLHLKRQDSIRCDLLELQHIIDEQKESPPGALCDLYRGDLLAGLEGASEELEDWTAGHRHYFHMVFSEKLANAVSSESYSRADRSRCAARLLSIDPYHEDACQFLMRDAAEHHHLDQLHLLYTNLRTLLATELGIAPSAETQLLYHQLMNQNIRASSSRR
ncbi:BTAD domain-containing putative transcriptional regulator [Devosia algicola]|uniref:BTAD domain-containing putative transcriptional regulator n=1 Tax=Devosia algicola TaxID=3026418 RepID=A0ABY7YNU3_9HYPH|nr:BTAD domain-containing putative transcriptional regulator [Devosia algicola]WDR02973.1 BTAD domain-containing putative transcriptional regulator [Devosia algicola]